MPYGDTQPKCVGYTRVSSLDQAVSGIGIEHQTERIQDYWKFRLEKEKVVWGGIYCDQAVSGASPFLKRPAGRELTKNLRPGDQIVISTLDRSFRTMREGLATFDSWRDLKYGVHILDIGQGQAIDLRSASGRFFLQMMLAAAEFEYRRICERNKYAADKRRARGLPIGKHQAPLGMKWVGRKGKKRLAEDPHDMSIIRHIIRWHEKGWSLEHCWRTLWLQNVRTSEGKHWSRSRVNRAYYGQMKALYETGIMYTSGYDDRGSKLLQWRSEEIRDRYFAGEAFDSLVKLVHACTKHPATDTPNGSLDERDTERHSDLQPDSQHGSGDRPAEQGDPRSQQDPGRNGEAARSGAERERLVAETGPRPEPPPAATQPNHDGEGAGAARA